MKRTGLAVLVIVAILLAGGGWLLSREATLVWVADRVQARMGDALRMDNVHGSLLGEIHMDHLRWQGKTLAVAADNATLAWAPWWLLTGKLAFRHARADTLAIARQRNPDEPGGLPDKLHVPLRLRFADTSAQTFLYTPPGEPQQTYHDVAFGVDFGDRAWQLDVDRFQTRWGRVHGSGNIATDAPHVTRATLAVSPEGHAPTVPPVSVSAKADGTLDLLAIEVTMKAQDSIADGHFEVAPFARQSVRTIDAALHHFNPHHLGDRIPEGSLEGRMQAQTGNDGVLRGRVAIDNRVRGLLNEGKLPLARLAADITASPGRWQFQAVQLDFGDAGKLAGDGWASSDEAALRLVTDALDLSHLHGALWPTHLAGSIATSGPRDAQHVAIEARDGRVAFSIAANTTPARVQIAHARAQANGGGSVQMSGAFDLGAAHAYEAKASLANFNPSAFGKYPAAKLNGRFTAQGALAPVLQVKAQGSVTSSTLHGLAVTGTGRFVSRGQDDPAIGLDVRGTVGATQVQARGTLVDPGNLQALDLDLVLSGKNLSELYTATGLPFPDTPPYRLRGTLALHDATWTLRKFRGDVGRSDLAGEFLVDLRRQRPFMRANLTSDRLDLRDLGGFVGASVQGDRNPDRVLAQSEYQIRKLNAADADITFNGRRIRNEGLPLRQMTAHLVLDRGQVTLHPLIFKAAGGDIAARITMDARRAPIRTVADMQARGLQLNRIAPGIKAVMESTGTIDGRTRLSMTGNSVAKMLGSADGNLMLAMNGGTMSDLVLRLANLDVAHAIGIMARGDKPIAVQCFVADFAAQDGVLRPRTFVLDSEHTVIRGEGSVNLRAETLAMRLVAEPKDGSIFALRGPIRIDGKLAKPTVHPELTGLAGRIAAAVALGAVATPLAAIVPFLEAGKKQDVDCEPLILDASRFIKTGSPPPTLEAKSDASAAAGPRSVRRATDQKP